MQSESASLLANLLLFEHCIVSNIFPAHCTLRLVFLASMHCYHRFNTSCVILEEERLYVMCLHFIFSPLSLFSGAKGKVKAGQFGGVA